MERQPANAEVARQLREAADLIDEQGGNPFRAGAYRRAADTIEGLPADLRDLLEREGEEGLLALPHVGKGIAAAIGQMLRTGRWGELSRLRAGADPVRLFQRIPGVGPCLARRIHERLHVETLEALEAAAHDGSLEQEVEGVGPRRAAAIRAALAAMLGRGRALGRGRGGEPGVEVLLDVDREYREAAEAGRLPTIAPRRFNPERRAWLPVLHTRRGPWRVTALYSNTARAHQLGRTRDWVVLFFTEDGRREGQRTVVTETRGPLAGRRVVRGREAECAGAAGAAPAPALQEQEQRP